MLADLRGSTEPGLECELEQCPAAVTVQRVGHSIVAFQGGDSPFRRQIELVVGAGGLGWAVHLSELREGTRDLPTRPECGGGAPAPALPTRGLQCPGSEVAVRDRLDAQGPGSPAADR